MCSLCCGQDVKVFVTLFLNKMLHNTYILATKLLQNGSLQKTSPKSFAAAFLPVSLPNQANPLGYPFCPGKDFETLATRVLPKGNGESVSMHFRDYWRPFCWMFSVVFSWFSHFSLINSDRFSRTICCKSSLRHSLGGGIAKLVALQLPVQSRPMTIAFAAPGVQYAARVLLGHTSRDGNIQLRKRPGWGLKFWI